MMHRKWIATFALTFVIFSGCNRQFYTTYGPSAGVEGRSSINGFGALRASYENAGYDTRDVRRLTDRTGGQQVIVWTPQVMKSTEPKVTRWFERWLRRGNRTLVYIVPDSGSEANYWVQAGQSAPPKQRMEYRRKAANKLNERLQWTVNRRGSFTNGWFVVKPKSEIFRSGNLSAQNWDLASQATDEEQTPTILTEYVIEPYEPVDPNAKSNATTTAPVVVNKGFVNTGPTGPAAPFTPYSEENLTKTEVDFEPIVTTESGDTIVAKITSDKWSDSQIIVVAGGSLLTNFAFTQDVNVKLANELIAQCQAMGAPAETVSSDREKNAIAGFLLSSYSPIPVSKPQSGVPQASGMELLTVWPVSLVTIHAALLGFVVCMMLFPIFGRPREIDRGSQSRFGDHLDAVAGLMLRARGEKYARSRISEYMRRMKGETSGDWVLPEEPKSLPRISNPTSDESESKETEPPHS